MPSTATSELSDSALPTLGSSSPATGGPDIYASISAELDRGFSLCAMATLSKRTSQIAVFEQSLQSARLACERAQKLLAELPAGKSVDLEMRFNALHSIVVDAPGTGLVQTAAHG